MFPLTWVVFLYVLTRDLVTFIILSVHYAEASIILI